MLRDAKTTSIVEGMRRPPLGGDIVSAANAAGIEHFFVKRLWREFIPNSK